MQLNPKGNDLSESLNLPMMLERGISSQCDCADTFFFFFLTLRTLFLSWLQMVALSMKKTEVKQREGAWTSPALSAQTKQVLWGSAYGRRLLIQETCWSGLQQNVCFYWCIDPQFTRCKPPSHPGAGKTCRDDSNLFYGLLLFFFLYFPCYLYLLVWLKEKLCMFHFSIFCKRTKYLGLHSHPQVTLTSVHRTFWRDPISSSLCFDWETTLATALSSAQGKKTSLVASLTSFYFRWLIVTATWFHY